MMKMLRPGLLSLALLPATLLPLSASAATWQVDPAASTLGFTGTQLGQPFKGRFEKFSADIDFDPTKPEQGGKVTVLIDMASARTGDAQRDGAMPETDWFAVKSFAQAKFEATSFRRTGDDAYEAVGTLTLRDVTKPLTLPFTLKPDGNATRAQGKVTLVRSDFGVGQGQWATGQWVALNVDVTFDLKATPKN